MIRKRKISHAQEAGDVNVTPLLDIVFIMLIFFIVTATFVYEDGVRPNMPPASEEPPKNPPPAKALFVQEDGFVRIDGARIVDPKSVKPVIDEFLASEPDGVVQITTALDSDSGVSITVLDQATLAARSYNAQDRITIAKASE